MWPLLLALLVLGWVQSRPRRTPLARQLILPAVMTALSLAGTLASFGFSAPHSAAWLAALTCTAWLVGRSRAPAGTCFDAATGRFDIPGSWAPMGLILAIFATKYGVGVALSLRPALAGDAVFGLALGGLYGVFSGVFVGRAVRLLRLRGHPELAPGIDAAADSRRPSAWRWVAGVLAVLLLPATLVAALVAFGDRDAPPALAAMKGALARADDAGLPALEHFTARDGALLAWRVYRGPAGAPVAVLVHGSSADSHAMHGVARALAAAGITAYALDVRGHGASGPRGDIGYVGQLDDDLADTVALLRRRHPGARLALVGHSSGGGFTLRIAGGRPELFDAHLMLAPLLHQDAPTTRPGVGGWAVPFVPRIAGLTLLDSLGLPWFQHLPVLAFALPPQAAATHTMTYSYRLQASFRPHEDYLGDLRRIARPTALLVGAADELFVAGAYAPLVASVRSDLPVRVLPGIGHIGLVRDSAALAEVVDAVRTLLAVAPAAH